MVHEDIDYTEYQCLQCYNKWCGGGISRWKYCPFCATQWLGEHVWSKKYYHPKKHNRGWEYALMDRAVFPDCVGEWQQASGIYSHYEKNIDNLKNVLKEWRELVAETKSDNKDYYWYTHQVRLVMKFDSGKEKVVFEYLPVSERKKVI